MDTNVTDFYYIQCYIELSLLNILLYILRVLLNNILVSNNHRIIYTKYTYISHAVYYFVYFTLQM